MTKLLFGVTVSVLLIVLAANLVAFLMPVLTHWIATLIFLTLFGLFAMRAYASDK